MNFKNFKIGTKLNIGFGVLIIITIVIGGIAIFNMQSISRKADLLANGHADEVALANEIQKNALLATMEMRGYVLTLQGEYLKNGEAYLKKLHQQLPKAKELSQKFSELEKLNEAVDKIESNLNNYETLSGEINSANEKVASSREAMNESAKVYLNSCFAYLENQNRDAKSEILQRNMSIDRLQKITLINDIIDIGNAMSVANLVAQNERNISAIRKVTERFDEVEQKLTEIRKYTRQEQALQELQKIEKANDEYRVAMETLIHNWEISDQKNNERENAGDLLLQNADMVTNAGISNTQKLSDESISLLTSSSNILIVGLLIALALGFSFAYFITRAITTPIAKGVEFAGKLADGDLTATVDVNQKDEVGDLANALRRMVTRLREIVGNVVSGADNISSASIQMSSNSQQISQGANEQASSAEEVSSSMEEMAANIQQNTDNAQQTEKIALKAADDVLEGSSAVNQTVDSMKSIADKITIIGEIARQTNILALNAAVEAARAGEHGKGFAVVAAEVRKLAERSQAAAADIDQLSKSSVEIAEKSGKLLGEIVPDIQKTAKLVQEISAASNEQNSGANQVNSAIQQLNQITQQNAASSEEMATSSEELSSQAEQLMEIITYFKIGGTTRNKKKKLQKTAFDKPQKEIAPVNKNNQNQHQDNKNGVNIDLDDDNKYEKF